ncbi:MAG: hypothetical protein IJT82_07245 [Schwartzia sp.]|nr:hypothetical protein [Schwartzia sp. (in: firmicutes)]
MGAIDTEAKAYLSSPERVADAFNYLMYGGRDIIKPEELSPMDTTAVALPYGNGKRQPLQKVRDVLKLYSAMKGSQAYYLILGIEIQNAVHLAMPVRNMLYDAMSYAQQVSDIAAAHRKAGDKLDGEEFLAGITKDDLLMPVITLVISLSSEKWDGATSLHDMLSVKDKGVLSFVPDYKLNLITPADMTEADFDKFRTELGIVLDCIKHKQDKDMNWMKSKEKFTSVTRNTASFIKTVTGFNISLEGEGDVVDMWNAWENSINQARMDGEAIGENRGIQAGRNEGELNMMTAIRMMKENKSFSEIGEKTGLAQQRLTELKAML